MVEIIPAIIPESMDDLRSKLVRVKGLAPFVQIDFCDGKFVKNKSWPFHKEDQFAWKELVGEAEGLPYWEDFSFEADLMIREPDDFIKEIGMVGFSRAIVHVASTKDIEGTITAGRRFEMGVGIAIGRETDIKKLDRWIELVDFVQVMGIEHIGVQGEPFDEHAFIQVKELRRAYPSLSIGVDGGVTLENAPKLIKAGATRLVVGSALFGSADIKDTVREFQLL